MSTVKTLNFKVNGLYANQQYKFNFTNKGGNWPVKVSPLSGIFYPSGLKTYVYFCANTGECPPSDTGVIFNFPSAGFTVPGLSLDNKSLYTILELSVTEIDTNKIVQTYPCIVECDECVPTLSVNTNNINLTSNTGPSAPIIADIAGLIPNQSYSYRFTGAGGTWPIIVTPASGTLIASTGTTTITSLASICRSSSACPQSDTRVLNSASSSVNNLIDTFYSAVTLSIDPIDTTNSNFQNSAQSSFSVSCKDCIPRTSIRFSGSSVLELQSSCCSGNRLISANVFGAEPFDSYSWSLSSASNDITFSPNTGTVVFPMGGSGSIMSIMNTTLSTNQASERAEQAFITINLSKTSSGYLPSPSVSDTILVRCKSTDNCTQ